jgi:hypothetical protein
MNSTVMPHDTPTPSPADARLADTPQGGANHSADLTPIAYQVFLSVDKTHEYVDFRPKTSKSAGRD